MMAAAMIGFGTAANAQPLSNTEKALAQGTFGGVPTSYYDLWRVENGKIAEHWEVMETIADEATWQNQNSKF